MNKKKITRFALNFLSKFPDKVLHIIIRSINYFRIRHIINSRIPLNLTFFVTNKCNASCNHCFYWQSIANPKSELSLNEIEMISAGLKGLTNIILTGGEPFLRKDLDQIASSFFKNGTKVVSIPTNGILTAQIIKTTQNILKKMKSQNLKISVSIDGPPKIHDKIRNKSNCFNHAWETIIQLKKLQMNYPNLKLSIITVISSDNFKHLDDLLKRLTPLNVPLIFSVVRSNKTNSFGISKKAMENFEPRKKSILLSNNELDVIHAFLKENTNQNGFIHWNIFQQLKFSIILDNLKSQKSNIKCLAGLKDAVIYENGDVTFCEMRKVIGNLKDYNMDIRTLWCSKAAQDMREKTKNCTCIHGCNLMFNLVYDPDYIKKVVKNY